MRARRSPTRPPCTESDDLVIPPAWKKVWITPHPNGHIQAVGTDAAGAASTSTTRAWQQERAEEKFDRVLEMSTAAAGVARGDRRRPRGAAVSPAIGCWRWPCSCSICGYFRAGGEQYAEENDSYGLATLLCEHVTVRRDAVEFDFPAKSGVRRTVEIDDPEVVRAVRALMRRPDRTATGCWCAATDPRLDRTSAPTTSTRGSRNSSATTTRVKDLRTWHGTVLAAAAFVDADPPVLEDGDQAGRGSGDEGGVGGLGNTPAVARAPTSTHGLSRDTRSRSPSRQAYAAPIARESLASDRRSWRTAPDGRSGKWHAARRRGGRRRWVMGPRQPVIGPDQPSAIGSTNSEPATTRPAAPKLRRRNESETPTTIVDARLTISVICNRSGDAAGAGAGGQPVGQVVVPRLRAQVGHRTENIGSTPSWRHRGAFLASEDVARVGTDRVVLRPATPNTRLYCRPTNKRARLASRRSGTL